MLNKNQRLFLGLFVLLLVDIIWVSSSELTKYIYHNQEYEKPFFSTYLKTSLFTFYLFGLCLWPPWRDYYTNVDPYKSPSYLLVSEPHDDENFTVEDNSPTSLGEPVFVPVKTPNRETCSEDMHQADCTSDSDDGSIRSVRFNKLAEVRQMPDNGATEALLARLSYHASLRASEAARRAANRLPTQRIAKIALLFCLLWFAANYTFQLALSQTEAATVTVLSSTSSLFTLVLAALFPSNIGDRFTISKLIAVCLSITGVALVTFSDIQIDKKVPTGVVLALVSALFYAAYLVFLRRKVDHEDKMDIPLFFGFVGLFNLVLLWPALFIFHYSNLEMFEWPTRQQWLFLLANGIVGTVLSEVLWLWGCFLTSSLIATVAISLTIPMSMLADVLLKRVNYSMMFYLGTVPMLVAFFAVTLLAHYDNWDPVMAIIKRLYKFICKKRQQLRYNKIKLKDFDEQTEALIGINSGDHEA
ncbi:solute carrier family 35 member F5-like isoform X3 [Ctenocephalides felis]|uniref:solute carrier family 35 member F5-like isoform X3 n=1 Tax=Ctenocephalides felis TaxID=7515 RepID=UPI000E6E1CE9|nr:solute carrier family 35 member F5-like isoform X3 [Ctenocephalides felis]